MTRDDFEKITAIDDVKNGRVRIELRYLGFTVVSMLTGPRVKQVISYLEADQAIDPVVLFEVAIMRAHEMVKS